MIRDLFDFRWPKPIKTDLAKWDRNRRYLVDQSPTTSTTPKVVISYIHGGPIDKKYNSKQKRQRLLRAIFVREWISFIQHNLPDGSTHPIDGIITFPPINANRVNETPTIYPRKPVWYYLGFGGSTTIFLETSDTAKRFEDLSHFNAIMRRVWPHIEYSDWLANAVVIPKKGRKWRVYVNCTNLNDACPRDSFPLPE
ncbi:hypothetical protein AAG906_012975 [Vitis piasezkii]